MVNESIDVLGSFWDLAPPGLINGLELVVDLAAIAGVLFIAYIIFLIIRSWYRARAMNDLKRATRNITQINDKLDKIIELLEGKKPKSKKKRKKS